MHYVAPEVLQRSYTEKADMWSLGVLLYMMLTGGPLFKGRGREIAQKVRHGKVEFSQHFESKCSGPARDLVRRLLSVDPVVRPSAQEALQHPWIAAPSTFQHKRQLEAALRCGCAFQHKPQLEAALLCGFRGLVDSPPFRRAVLSAIAVSASGAETAGVRSLFLSMDDVGRGIVPRSGLAAWLKAEGSTDEEVETILAGMDFRCGLAYNDFLAAALCGGCIDIDENTLLRTFALFDRTGCGAISPEQVNGVWKHCLTEEVTHQFHECAVQKVKTGEVIALKSQLHDPQQHDCELNRRQMSYDDLCGIIRVEIPALKVHACRRRLALLSDAGSCFHPFKQIGSRIYHKTEDIAEETRHTLRSLLDGILALARGTPSWMIDDDSEVSNFLL